VIVRDRVAMTSLKFYFDYTSEPSRAVALLLEVGNVTHEKYVIKLIEGMKILWCA